MLTDSPSSLAASAPIARRPLHEAAIDRLRDLIVQGELLPGSRLNERVLAGQLGISRTPLREAFKLLATEGLVELLPNRGAIVAHLDPERIRQTLAVMGALEALIGELACKQAPEAAIAEIQALHFEMRAAHARRDLAAYFRYNQAIHLNLAEAAGNAVLALTYRQLNANVRRVRYMANLSPERWDAAVREHDAILAALSARDGTRLKALLSDHLAQKTASVLAALAERRIMAAA
ncbi:MAG: GntR family transcriptional regulator [Betaproteobacteria bacterium]|nr:MAG: GntR family transcriptional regulator [Betaproteobacteria bacterium]